MYVAIKTITESGQPVYCVNPVETSLDFNKAFKFLDRNEIDLALKESKEIYNLNAMPVKLY